MTKISYVSFLIILNTCATRIKIGLVEAGCVSAHPIFASFLDKDQSFGPKMLDVYVYLHTQCLKTHIEPRKQCSAIGFGHRFVLGIVHTIYVLFRLTPIQNSEENRFLE